MGRLSDLAMQDEVLTKAAHGYRNAKLVADEVLPVVDVDSESVLIPKFGKEAFNLYETHRALRAGSNMISPEDFGSARVHLEEHDLAYPIDYREQAEAAFDLELHATYRSTEGVLLKRERAVADLLLNPATYPVDHVRALGSGEVFTDPASDPEEVVDQAKTKVASKIAEEPNLMVLGPASFKALRRHPRLRAILSENRARLLDLSDLAAIFEVERVVIGKAVQRSDDGVMSHVWDNAVVLAFVADPLPEQPGGEPRRNVYQPSFGYTLRRRGSVKVDKWSDDGKVENVRYTEISQPIILGQEAGFLIENAA